MNKAVVVGGSNGIGLAISTELIKRGFFVYVIDKSEPEELIGNYKHIKTDLSVFDESVFDEVLQDKDISMLMITAGFGRVAKFEDIGIGEIKKQMAVNAVSIMEIINMFYHRINDDKDFYTGIMVSIAGRIVSPLFSTYSASKAALSKFIEALNIELEKNNKTNRILEISPGSLKGTKFNGGQNNIELLNKISNDIIEQLLNKKVLFIPEYNEIYKDVIKRYIDNPLKFGLESYDYKIKGNRISGKKQRVGYLSGTFDLFHLGHLNLLKRAKENCDYLIVGVHPNAAHKGKETFIPLDERKAIVQSCKYVDRVVDSCPEDNDAWELYHYDRLFVGSDYKGTERFKRYEEYFKDKNVEIVYFPYTKSTSSTQIRALIMKETRSDNLKRN